MVMREDGIRVEGVRELTRALNKAGGRDLTKQMGAANKRIGQTVIDRLSPRPVTVGRGAGSKVRPSASSRLVQLRAGGAHRADPTRRQEWGGRTAYVPWGINPRPRRGTRRPHIAGTALRVYPQIERDYLAAIDRVLEGVER